MDQVRLMEKEGLYPTFYDIYKNEWTVRRSAQVEVIRMPIIDRFGKYWHA